MSVLGKPRFGRSLKPFHYPKLWMGLWVLAIAIVVAGSLLPGKDLPAVPLNDKTEHFIAYALLSGSAVQLFARRLSWAMVSVLLVLMGIQMEFLQAKMGLGRMLDWNDALANTMGVLMGLATALTPLRNALVHIDKKLASN